MPSGDAEGCNEMTYSMGYLRQFCRSFQQNAAATRIFFPDKKVCAVDRDNAAIIKVIALDQSLVCIVLDC